MFQIRKSYNIFCFQIEKNIIFQVNKFDEILIHIKKDLNKIIPKTLKLIKHTYLLPVLRVCNLSISDVLFTIEEFSTTLTNFQLVHS